MAISGSTTFTQTRNEILLKALQKIGLYGKGRTVDSQDIALASDTLNIMLAAWNISGPHLWKLSEGTLFVTPNEAEYTLGNSSSYANACLTSDAVITQLNGALADNAAAVTVDSTANMTVADNIGIIMSTGDVHWTTIATIPTSTTLTLSSGVTEICNDNAYVYTYTNRIYKPLKIFSCRRVTGIDSGATSTVTETNLGSISYQEYMNFTSKRRSGTMSQFHYNPLLSSGKLFIWQRPSDATYRIEFTFARQLDDLISSSDEADFPKEWLDPIIWQLAVRLCPDFGKEAKLNYLAPIAQDMLDSLKDWDNEINSIYLSPDGRR